MPKIGRAKVGRKGSFDHPLSINASYIGIDPGASGGLAILAPKNSEIIPMPLTEKDIWDWFYWFKTGIEQFAVIEKVSGYIGEAQPGSAAFKFGMSYGGLRMALIAAGISFEEVTPQAWQKALGLLSTRKTKGKRTPKEKREHKARIKAKAQQLFPGVKVTLKTADALMLAEFCRRKREGTL